MTRDEVAAICKAMSDENRLKVLEMLTKGEKCACVLLEDLQVSQPTLSHHMKVLSACGLVVARKEGKWQHYAINCRQFAEFKDYIGSIRCQKKERICNMVIKVLGGGCHKCEMLLENVNDAVAKAGVEAKVEYITDYAVIGSYGVMSTPALVIDEKVVAMGKVLKSAEIAKLLR